MFQSFKNLLPGGAMSIYAHLGFVALGILLLIGALCCLALALSKVNDPFNNINPFNSWVGCIVLLAMTFVGIPMWWQQYDATEAAKDTAFSKSITDQGFVLVNGGRYYDSLTVALPNGCTTSVRYEWDENTKQVTLRDTNSSGVTYNLTTESLAKLCGAS